MKSQDAERTNSKTMLQSLFEGKEILTARPEGMDYNTYKDLLRIQNFIIKRGTRSKPDVNVARVMPIRYGYNQHFKNLGTILADASQAGDQGVRL